MVGAHGHLCHSGDAGRLLCTQAHELHEGYIARCKLERTVACCKSSPSSTRLTGYPPKGVTNSMWADRVVVDGSQDVIAAKCCPGHSVAAQEERKRTK